MKKIILTFCFFLSIILLSLFPSPVFSQTTKNYRWTCLEPCVCWNRPNMPSCVDECFYVNGHSAKLRLKELPPGGLDPSIENYIVMFITIGSETLYTTGNSGLDLQIFGQDNLSIIKQKTPTPEDELTSPYHWPQYHFIGLFDQKPIPYPPTRDADATNEIWGEQSSPSAYPLKSNTYLSYLVNPTEEGHLEWTDYSHGNFSRQWKLLSIIETTAPTAVPTVGGQQRTQQQGTLAFDFTQTASPSALTCTNLWWDPYGRVFDSQSLEPIAGALVTLQKRVDKSDSFVDVSPFEVPLLTNPYLVKEDGIFNFAVPDGDYKLVVYLPTHTFPADLSKVHPNYSKAYYEIYKGEIIEQRGKIQHRDIPVDPKTTPFVSEVKLMSYQQNLDKTSNKLLIEGRTSHPLTTINFYSLTPDEKNQNQMKRSRLITSLSADKWGQFKVAIDQTNFAPTEVYGEVELIKANLTQTASPQSVSQQFEPILNYLEGYATDSLGNPIPYAEVLIFLKYSSIPYFETKADEKGYFRIASKNLPFMPYTIKFLSPTGKKIEKTPFQFVTQNLNFLTTNKVSLNSFRNEQGKLIPTQSQNKTTSPFQKDIYKEQKSSIKTIKQATSQQKLILILIIILGLIGTSSLILGLYLYRKKSETGII